MVKRRGGNKLGLKVPPGMYLVSQLAKRTGVSVTTLKRWMKEGDLIPKSKKPYGQTLVNLFSEESVEEVIEISKKKRKSQGKRRM